VSLTYLLCRILDTIEDAKWPNTEAQLKAYKQFDRFMVGEPVPVDWAQSFPEGIADGEAALLNETQSVVSDLLSAPQPVRLAVQELAKTMSAGMRHFSKLKSASGLRLKNLIEVNQYCFFVAGLVGEALSKLLAVIDGKMQLSQTVLVDAHHFGLFLQKVNLLKDQFQDETEGRYLVPNRTEVFSSLQENAEGAMRYVETISLEHVGYRIFCLWSLFLGLRTLPVLNQMNSAVTTASHSSGNEKILAKNKITREEASEIFKKVEAAASKPQLLRQAYKHLIGDAFKAVEKSTGESRSQEQSGLVQNSSGEWVQDFYSGPLGKKEFASLKMV
jgi:phytoene/squalene synthetase